MKSIITILFTFVGSCLYGQYNDRPTKITIQQVKTNREIDSLMHAVISQCDTKEKCFGLEIVKSDDRFLFSINQIPTSSSKILFPPVKIDDYAFFYIEGYTVFVIQDQNPFHFFKKINKWKSFSIGNPQKDIPDSHGSPYFGIFSYTDGRFQSQSTAAY